MDKRRLRDWLITRVAALAGISAEVVEADQPLSSYGLDSVRIVALTGELESSLGGRVDPEVVFEFPTIAELADHLAGPTHGALPVAMSPARAAPGAPSRVAIVGIGCRMPGAAEAERFWKLLEDGDDAITEVPADRWDAKQLYAPDPAVPGRVASKWGGFIDGVAEFDARFFRIQDEEALHMDPQQRLLLETCWEALEDAGTVPARLRGSRTGVYVGISMSEYGNRQLRNPGRIGPYTPTGNALSVAANRVSYAFDLHGPSVALDTACSSSLVATHLACQALRGGECDLALAGGVNLLLDPEITMGLGKAGMLAPDGRCKTFAATADGYVRGEGCGVLVLKLLEAAVAAGDRIYAVISGSAVNQDGASNGLTAPNPAAQRDVLKAAYCSARVEPSLAQYVECHGTGTFLGDPIEAHALGAVVSVGRPAGSACLIGSVKSNIGHLEAAAGIAGLIKTALALHHERIPASLHCADPNPHISFTELGLVVPTKVTAWPGPRVGRAAGVSSFGFGGTNAHMVLEPSPPQEPRPAPVTGPLALPLSARSRPALEARLRTMAKRLAGTGPDEITAVAYTAAVRRTHHRPFRLAVAADDPAALARLVRDAAARPAQSLARAKGVAAGSPRVGFIFSGQGSLWPGMASQLLDADSLFRSAIRRCDEILAEQLGWSIEAALRDAEERDFHVDDTTVAQPLLVAVQLALVKVWQALGVEPVAVAGHSIGEASAAVVAGLLDMEAGLRLAALRGRLMGAPGGEGRMLAVGLSRDEAEACAWNAEGEISLAAVNGPRATVLAGDEATLGPVRESLRARGVFARWLPTRYAFHSPRMRAAAEALFTELGRLRPEQEQIGATKVTVPYYSSILGRRVVAEDIDHAYWARGVHERVDFADAAGALLDDGVDAVLEISPDPVLHTSLRQLASARDRPELTIVHSLRDGLADSSSLLDGVCRLYDLGCEIRWEHLFPKGGRTVSLPPHPWERQRYWIEPTPARPRNDRTGHPLLGARLDLARGDDRLIWETVVGLDATPTLSDHRVAGAAMLPASAYIEIAHAAAHASGLDTEGTVTLHDLVLHHALALDAGAMTLQTTLTAEGEAGYALTVHARSAVADRPDPWSLYASGRLVTAPALDPEAQPRHLDMSVAELRCREQVRTESLYELLAAQRLDYGPAFRGVREVWRTDGEAIGTVTLEPSTAAARWSDSLRLLDAALHLVAAAATPAVGSPGAGDAMLPVAIETVRWWSPVGTTARVHVLARTVEEGRLRANLVLLDRVGRSSVEVEGLEVRRVAVVEGSDRSPATAEADAGAPESSLWLYEPRWRERPLDPASVVRRPAGRWLVFADRAGTGRALVEQLRLLGAEAVVCTAGSSYRPPVAGEASVDPRDPAHYRRLVDEVAAAVSERPLAGVLHLWSLDQPEPAPGVGLNPAAAALPATSVLHLVQALSLVAGSPPPLLVATRGSQLVGPGPSPDVTAPLGATVWGLLKTVPIENSLLRFTCVDLHPTHRGDTMVTQLLAEMAGSNADAEVAYDRDGRRLVRRLVEVGRASPARSSRGQRKVELSLPGEATWVISGGTGALGLQVAARLAERGVRRLALLARDPDRPGVADAVARLRRAPGVKVQVVPADVRDRAKLERVLAAIRSSGPPIRGVIHAAGVLDDNALLQMSASSLQTVFEPKVIGGWNLHELTSTDPLDWFVVFASAAGVLGSPGQANYTAANAWLDALAHHRRQAGQPALAVDWGPWAGRGMAAGLVESSEGRRLRTATSAIDPSDGLAIFEWLLAENRPQTVVLPFDLRDLLQFYPAGSGLSFFEEITTEEVCALKSIGVQALARPDLAVRYVAPRTGVEGQIVGIWQRSLGIEPVGVLETFFELGGDSLFANQILVEINRTLGVTIQPERAFENFTVAHLAELATEQVVEQLGQMSDEEAERLLAGPPGVDGLGVTRQEG